MQVLYEGDTTQHDWQYAFAQRIAEEPLPPSAETFARELLGGITQNRTTLDAIIQQIAPEWPLDQIAIVDRNILRIGVFETLMSDATPMKVAINEAVELAKLFGGEHSSRFVNGALGTLADRHNEFVQQLNRLSRSA